MLRTYWREACRRRRREARAGPDRRRAQSPGKGERPYLGRVGRTVNPLWAGTVGGLGHIGDQAIKPRPAIRPLALVRPCNKPGHTAPEVHRTSPSPARAPAAAAPVIYLVILLFLIHILSSEMVRRPASRRHPLVPCTATAQFCSPLVTQVPGASRLARAGEARTAPLHSIQP